MVNQTYCDRAQPYPENVPSAKAASPTLSQATSLVPFITMDPRAIALTEGDRLTLLETHPLFTGRCPSCAQEFAEAPAVHWDCDECGWKNDSA